MFKLSKTDHCVDKQGISRRIELSFTDGDKTIKHTIQPGIWQGVVVLEDVRHIYFGDNYYWSVEPFPRFYYDLQYLGKLGGDYIFRARGHAGQTIMTLSIQKPNLRDYGFHDKYDTLAGFLSGGYMACFRKLGIRIYEKGENPTIDKLLKVNNAREIYVFDSREGYVETRMFSVSQEMKLSEIRFISRAPGSHKTAIVRFGANEDYLFGIAIKGGVYIATPNDAEERGYLYWQKDNS